MIKDIERGEVTEVAIAVIPENNDAGEKEWWVYLINQKNTPLETVLINAEGKGMLEGEERRTATLRFFLDTVGPESFRKFEMLLPEAFELDNQYWVSFYHQRHMFDKKFILKAGTVQNMEQVMIPLIDRSGILIL